MYKITIFTALCIAMLASAKAQNNSPTTLAEVFEPVVVGIPPSDAYIGLSKMEDGELRHYNYGEQPEKATPLYLSSYDNGFTWKGIPLIPDVPYADTKSPISGEYIRAFHGDNCVYVVRTEGGINGDRTLTKIDTTLAIMLKPPVFIDGGERIVIAAHGVDRKGCFTYVSSDDGKTWQKSNRVNAPAHEAIGVHKGIRWNHGAVEPTVVEIEDGRLWMIMRTAQDRHYQSFSEDGGLTWCEPTPSPFYGTITMPTFYKIADGRILFFWSNTTPLPEVETATTGYWEDVFTNRSASHVAISEDSGKTWIGMRELILDQMRNSPEFGTSQGRDKSVHQAQAVEVEPGKILVSAGQNKLNRKMLLFDVDWLYEDSRSSNFSDDLNSWSAFRYYKGIVGHCGYNRQEAPLLVAHPEKDGAKVMKIGYAPNSELVDDKDGAIWNFPAAKNGEVTVRLMIPEGAESINLIINDRWFNPTDEVAKDECQYCVNIDRSTLKIKDSQWHNVTIRWQHNSSATIYVDGKKRGTCDLVSPTEHGSSYLHILGGTTPDQIGVMIESVEAHALLKI
ncbi:MAG: exo-alpha-sialidase [Rikenellaceae bacterium]